MLKNLDMVKIRLSEKVYCTLEKIKGDGLPDRPPWFDNESDVYEELPMGEYPYE